MLYATVRNRKIHVKKPDTVVQKGVKVDWLHLEMDDEWAEMESIVCVFVNRHTEEVDGKLTEKEITKEMLHTFGQQVLVPWECLVNTGMLSVSCTGYVGGEKIMTTMYPDSFWNVVQNGPVSGDETIEPTASLYNQILAAAGEATAAAIAANQAKEQLLQDKANGVFNGEDGVSPKVSVGSTQTGSEGSEAEVFATGTEQDLKLNFVIPTGKAGRPGKDGHTPQKGVDYWTPEEQDEVANAVKNANDAARSVTEAITRANDAVGNANSAASGANTAAGQANTAAGAANTAASNANTAEREANAAANNANTAAGKANAAANAANSAASAANSAADEANSAASELQRAAAAGEFDGKDGTSVTVSSITESSVDGGTNVIKFSDGKTLNIKNGKTGAPGKDFTYEDFTPEQLEALTGPTGPAGPGAAYRRIWYTDMKGEGAAAGELLFFDQMSGAVEPTLETVQEYDILISRADNSFMYVTIVHDGSIFADKKPRAGIGPVMGYVEGLSGGEGETIESIERTSGDGSPGTTDTYTITTTSGKTTEFQIYNGKDGKDGEDGVSPTVTLGHFAEGLRRGVRIMFTDADGKKDPVDIWDGYTPNLTIGTVETLPAGSEATADLTTADGINYNLNFGIPKGTGTADMMTLTVGFDSKCDYVCDGTADEEQINAALAALPDDGGLVLLKSGTYNLTGSINETAKKNNVELRGDYAGKVHLVRDRANTTTSFSAQFNICSKHQVLRNLSVENDGTGSFEDGYVVNILAGVESVLFDQCVFSGHRYGIRTVVGMGAKSSSATVRNCVFANNSVGAYLQELGCAEACQFQNNGIGVRLDLANKSGFVRDCVFTDNDIGIQDCGSGTQITGNVITRGGGTAADYTADQHTILMGMSDTSGAKYGTGNVIAFNQLRGKDVSFQAAEPASDAYAAAKESTVIIPFEAGGGSSDSSLLTTKQGSTITYLKDVTLTFSNMQAMIGQSLPIKEGQACTVVCDGTAYETVARSVVYEGMPALALGNLTFMGGEDTGEPFLLGTIEAMGLTMIVLLGNGDHTFTVYSTEPDRNVIDHERYLDFGWYPTVSTADEVLLEETTLGALRGQDNLGFSLPAVGSILTVTINGTPYEYPVLTCGLYAQVFGSEMARTAGGVFNGNGSFVGAPVVFAQSVSQETCTFTLVDTSLDDSTTISVSAKALKYNPIPSEFLADGSVVKQKTFTFDTLNVPLSTGKEIKRLVDTGVVVFCKFNSDIYKVLHIDFDFDGPVRMILAGVSAAIVSTTNAEEFTNLYLYTELLEDGPVLRPLYPKLDSKGAISVNSVVVNSSTEGSTKKFRITVDDNGTLTATEVV